MTGFDRRPRTLAIPRDTTPFLTNPRDSSSIARACEHRDDRVAIEKSKDFAFGR
jgi:hypothetical protein